MSVAYLRYPHLHHEKVVFTAADDVWMAPLGGGKAWRLSDDGAPVAYPRISPDGATVAWSSRRDGNVEVVVAPTDGGAAERLTWFGSDRCAVLGWRDSSTVFVATDAGQGPRRRDAVHAVGLDGGVERLAYGPASAIAVHGSGGVVLASCGSRDPAAWKRYRGGTAVRLWFDPRGKGNWRRLLPDEDAALVDPLWIGDTLVFASDLGASFPGRADEQANLWALDAKANGDLRQVTHHGAAQGYVRNPTTDGERVVYHARGEIYLLPSLDAEPQRLALTLGGAVGTRRRRALAPSENLTGLRPDHGADASLVEWRGKVFCLAHREGPARAVVADSGVRAREPRPLGTTSSVLVVTDRDGEDRIEIHDLAKRSAPRVFGGGKVGRVLDVEASADGATIATVSHDGSIRLGNVSSGRLREIHRSVNGEPTSLTFSPDGRYLAWSEPATLEGHGRIVGIDVRARGAKPVALTNGRFSDLSPTFSRDGKFLMFLSARTFDPAYDQQSFNLSFPSSVRPYLVPLAADDPAPFGPSADGWRLSTAPPAPAPASTTAAAGQKKTASTPASPAWDVEGFEERIVPFPVPSGNYGRLDAVVDGAIWIHLDADQGVLGAGRAGTDSKRVDALEVYSFTKRKLDVLVDEMTGYAVSGDGTRVVVRDGSTVTVRPVDHRVKPDDHDHVTVDLGRLRFEVDPAAEWRQMFDETVRLMTENYWREDMNGVDWPAVTDRYLPALERVASRDDLVDLLWEVVGELNTSHAYVMPPDLGGDRSRRLGHLGADLRRGDDGWAIERILPGESSDPDARSPLRAAGVGAKVGDVIVAVDGAPVDERFGPAASLVGAANKPVELTLQRGTTDRRVVVVPLDDDKPLRYQDWVRGRSAYVDRRSSGKLGYVHVPDMASPGWAQLHRDIHQATARDGLIVDVRYNSGGHTSQLVIERIARRVVGWAIARHADDVATWPSDGRRGPLVIVTNEHAGSDGDIVNATAQALGLGPVVGMRTWGGVIGIDGRFDLIDGTGVTQPKYSFYLEGKGWSVENHGVDPDIEVEIAPHEILTENDRDRQLDRAVDEALKMLRATPAATKPPMPQPRVRPQ